MELSAEQAEADLDALDQALAAVVRRFVFPALMQAGLGAAGDAVRARRAWRVGLPGGLDRALAAQEGIGAGGGEGGGFGGDGCAGSRADDPVPQGALSGLVRGAWKRMGRMLRASIGSSGAW